MVDGIRGDLVDSTGYCLVDLKLARVSTVDLVLSVVLKGPERVYPACNCSS